MEIKLNKGDQIQIPVGHKAVIKGDMITIEEDEKGFKDGDILYSRNHKQFVIFSNYSRDDKRAFDSYFNNTNSSNSNWLTIHFRHATEEEKQYLFNKLKEQGLYWDATTKQLKKFIVRAKPEGKYLFIDAFGTIHAWNDFYCLIDNNYYNSGNYYLPEEQDRAEKDAAEIRKVYERRFKI